jgi:hypothetical protein
MSLLPAAIGRLEANPACAPDLALSTGTSPVAGLLNFPLLPMAGKPHSTSASSKSNPSFKQVKLCAHEGCHLAGQKFCRCFGPKITRRHLYVAWAVPLLKCWAVGRELRPELLRVVTHMESKCLADLLAARLSNEFGF